VILLGEDTGGGYGTKPDEITGVLPLRDAAEMMLWAGRKMFNQLQDTWSSTELARFYGALIHLERSLEGDNGQSGA
jgi:hypothetical protein